MIIFRETQSSNAGTHKSCKLCTVISWRYSKSMHCAYHVHNTYVTLAGSKYIAYSNEGMSPIGFVMSYTHRTGSIVQLPWSWNNILSRVTYPAISNPTMSVTQQHSVAYSFTGTQILCTLPPSMRLIPTNPSCRHATSPSLKSKKSSQTVPHLPEW